MRLAIHPITTIFDFREKTGDHGPPIYFLLEIFKTRKFWQKTGVGEKRVGEKATSTLYYIFFSVGERWVDSGLSKIV